MRHGQRLYVGWQCQCGLSTQCGGVNRKLFPGSGLIEWFIL